MLTVHLLSPSFLNTHKVTALCELLGGCSHSQTLPYGVYALERIKTSSQNNSSIQSYVHSTYQAEGIKGGVRVTRVRGQVSWWPSEQDLNEHLSATVEIYLRMGP